MKILRQADAWGIARANAEAARKKAQSKATQVNHERRELNRRLAEKLVGGWSAYEYREKFDDEIAKALDGEHDEVFEVNAARYTRIVSVQPRSFGADANAATAATEQRTKQRMTRFHSIRWNGEKA
jgi:hypothetical protein